MNVTIALLHRRFSSSVQDQGWFPSEDVEARDGMWLAPIAIAELPTPTPITIAPSVGTAMTSNAVAAPCAVQVEEISIAVTSNDTHYASGLLWGMLGDTGPIRNSFGSQANEAWAEGATGSTSSVVGVIDSGIDYTHPDLYLNIWLNQREIPTTLRASLADIDGDDLITFRDLNGAANASYVLDYNGNGRVDAGDLLNDARWENGADEDGNGYRDDLIGWDFANADNDPFDDHGHGTHVSGTIGAIGGNGLGVAGVNWTIQMVALKTLSAAGTGFTSSAVNPAATMMCRHSFQPIIRLAQWPDMMRWCRWRHSPAQAPFPPFPITGRPRWISPRRDRAFFPPCQAGAMAPIAEPPWRRRMSPAR